MRCLNWTWKLLNIHLSVVRTTQAFSSLSDLATCRWACAVTGVVYFTCLFEAFWHVALTVFLYWCWFPYCKCNSVSFLFLFIFLFENLEEPSTVPRSLALTGIAVRTKSVTSNNKSKIMYKWFRDNRCYQSSMTLEILIPGQVHMLKDLK